MTYDEYKLAYPPEYEQDEPEYEHDEYEWETGPDSIPLPEPKLRVIGYISGSRKKRATVWDNLDGTVSVVVDSKSVIVFSDVGQADSYAAMYAFGRQARMG